MLNATGACIGPGPGARRGDGPTDCRSIWAFSDPVAGSSGSTRIELFSFVQTAPEMIGAGQLFVDLDGTMTTRQAKLQEDTYFRVMNILQANPDLTQRELAEKLGVSVGGLNYCLKALINRGWIKMQNFSNSKNKFGYVYILTPRGIAEKAELTSNFLKRKLEEYEALKAEIATLRLSLADQQENDAPKQAVFLTDKDTK